MRVPMFGIGVYAKSPNVTSQRRVNLYYEVSQQEDKTQIAAYGTPGLSLFVDFGDTQVRGMWSLGDFMYAVHRGVLYKINNAGVKTSLGTLDTTSGYVSIADNGVQVMVVDGTSGYIYNTNTGVFTKIASGFPANPQTVTFLAGYFIVNVRNSGRFYVSSLYDGLTWDALDFANAESSPDNLVRVIADRGQLVLMGEYTTEFWQNTGGADFPFAVISGATIEYGAVSPWAVSKFDASLAYLARNRLGESKVLMLNGYSPTEVSDQSIDHIINNFSAISDAVSYSYMMDGHPFYVISFPSGGETWMFDSSSGMWSQLVSKGLTRHRANLQSTYINRNMVSDYFSGRIYYLSSSEYTDNGDEIAREIIGRHILDGLDYVFVSSFQLDMESGVGLETGQGSNPQVMLQISKDNGHTWGNEMWRSAGGIGQYLTRVIWKRLGRARDWVFKLRITDPVKVVITGAYLEMEKGQ